MTVNSDKQRSVELKHVFFVICFWTITALLFAELFKLMNFVRL